MERVLEEYERGPARLMRVAEDGGRFVRDTYSPEAEGSSIVECWGKILSQ